MMKSNMIKDVNTHCDDHFNQWRLHKECIEVKMNR